MTTLTKFVTHQIVSTLIARAFEERLRTSAGEINAAGNKILDLIIGEKVMAAMKRLPPASFVTGNHFRIAKNEKEYAQIHLDGNTSGYSGRYNIGDIVCSNSATTLNLPPSALNRPVPYFLHSRFNLEDAMAVCGTLDAESEIRAAIDDNTAKIKVREVIVDSMHQHALQAAKIIESARTVARLEKTWPDVMPVVRKILAIEPKPVNLPVNLQTLNTVLDLPPETVAEAA